VEIDLARASIVGNFISEALSSPSPFGKVLSSTSPFYIPFLEAGLGQNIYSGRPLRSEGDPTLNWNPQTWGTWFGAKGKYVAQKELMIFRPFRVLNDYLSTLPPWRKSDDSTIFDEKPYKYQTEGEAEAYKQTQEDRKRYEFMKEGTIAPAPVEQELFPFFPQPSGISSYMEFKEEQREENVARRKSRQEIERNYDAKEAISTGADIMRKKKNKSSDILNYFER
jgi:hypothetical protein